MIDREPASAFQAQARVVGIVVTYDSGPECRELIRLLKPQCYRLLVVDNGSQTTIRASIAQWCEESGAEFIPLEHNLGIAAAQNLGIRRARELGATHVLLSDDDSRPSDDMVASLLSAFAGASPSRNIAAIGPLVGEQKPGGDQLVYVPRRWGPRRAVPGELEQPMLSVAFLIASGCLIDMKALDIVGPMNSSMFIDHVDLEWGLRARRAGFELFVLTSCFMAHSLGDETVKLPGRTQPIHVHGPKRNYYLMRNTIRMMRSGLMPWTWNLGYALWGCKYAAFNMLLADRRKQRSRMVLKGLSDGLRGRGGPMA